MIKYIIVDDEPIAHDIILRFAKPLEHLEFKKSCHDALEAISYLSSNHVDLVFLDINMPQLDGLSMLKSLNNTPHVIITTAYKEYALEGYTFDVVDYLLKPFTLERFLSAVNRVKLSSENDGRTVQANPNEDSIFLKSDKKHFHAKLSDILFVESQGSYLKVKTTTETVITHGKISDFTEKLTNRFVRVHKSYIVNLDHIKSVEGNRIHLREDIVPIGQTFKAAFIERIGSS